MSIEFNYRPPDTASEVVFTANHLTDTDLHVFE